MQELSTNSKLHNASFKDFDSGYKSKGSKSYKPLVTPTFDDKIQKVARNQEPVQDHPLSNLTNSCDEDPIQDYRDLEEELKEEFKDANRSGFGSTKCTLSKSEREYHQEKSKYLVSATHQLKANLAEREAQLERVNALSGDLKREVNFLKSEAAALHR